MRLAVWWEVSETIAVGWEVSETSCMVGGECD